MIVAPSVARWRHKAKRYKACACTWCVSRLKHTRCVVAVRARWKKRKHVAALQRNTSNSNKIIQYKLFIRLSLVVVLVDVGWGLLLLLLLLFGPFTQIFVLTCNMQRRMIRYESKREARKVKKQWKQNRYESIATPKQSRASDSIGGGSFPNPVERPILKNACGMRHAACSMWHVSALATRFICQIGNAFAIGSIYCLVLFITLPFRPAPPSQHILFLIRPRMRCLSVTKRTVIAAYL